MERIENNLFRVLSSELGFYIKEYNDKSFNKNKWIAILDQNEFIYAVVVSDEKRCDNNYIDALNYLKNNYNKPINLNVVIVTRNQFNNINNNNYNKLIYSIENNKVVYSDDSCKPLSNIINITSKEASIKNSWFKDNILTLIIIFINVILFIISAIKSSDIYNINIYVLVDMGAKVNRLIDNGQVWRLITCGFLHGGVAHIFFNMYALKILGPEVELVYGKVKYIYLYVFSILGGSVFSYLFNKNSVSIGASGGIFGLLGAMIVFAYNNKNKISKNYIKGLIKVVIINLVIGITLSSIDNSAHLGGLTFGAILAFIFVKLKNNTKEEVVISEH